MARYSEQQFDNLVGEVQTGRVTRREFMFKAAVLGVSLPIVMQVLAACASDGGGAAKPSLPGQSGGAQPSAVASVAPAKFPLGWDPYPYEWGTDPIADNPDDATKWWLARTADMSARDDDPEVVLTPNEITELKALKPRVGHAWYTLAVPAIQGWQRFWKVKVAEWADPNILEYDVQAKSERQLLGAQFQIDQGILVAGNMSFDWVLFNEAMLKFHAANVATTSVITPAAIYYPITSTIMQDAATDFADMVKPIAEKLKAEGFSEVDAVWLTEKSPSWWSVSRAIGFQKGLDDPANQAICKINIVETVPVVENDSAQAAAEAAMQKYPNVHLFIMLAHQYLGAAAAVQARNRKDIWVAACDLDEGSATALLSGGWPTYITYSLPIAQLSYGEANVMGKLLLGKQVPLIVLSKGTVTTPDNVEEAYAHDWGGESLPENWRPG